MRGRGCESLFRPRSVAVVGASDNPNKVGGRPLKYLLEQGFAGRVYAVNPRQATVQGIVAHPSLDALPEAPDAAVLCIAAEQAEEQLALCARLGVAHALLFASGYAEVGAEGLAQQQRLVDICRAGGVRLLGPNSIGVASFDSGAVLSFASIYSDHAPAGRPGRDRLAERRLRRLRVRAAARRGHRRSLRRRHRQRGRPRHRRLRRRARVRGRRAPAARSTSKT